jgi:hypothetical protein
MVTNFENTIEASIAYLKSDEMVRSLEANAYWPKWNSPWWHMTLLHEMGLASRIPEIAVQKMVDRLKKSPITIFPVHPHENPDSLDLSLNAHCHCALGNIYQTLAAAQVDVEHELPWMRKWFLRYQLSEGGLNCDESAYIDGKVPAPNSIVGTISPLEAVLFHTARAFTDDEIGFLDLGAKNLIERKLMYATPNNPSELDDETDWLKLCFPRFYLYDVLRGLNLLLNWALLRKRPLPKHAVDEVVSFLKKRYPDGKIFLKRRSYEGTGTISQSEAGEWKRNQSASFFPLLDQLSAVDSFSPHLTKQWEDALGLLDKMEWVK